MIPSRVICAAAMLLLAVGTARAQAPDLEKMDIVLQAVPDGPVAVVDGKPVKPEVFRDLYMGEKVRWMVMSGKKDMNALPDEELLGIGLNSLRVLIEREVLYQEALKRKISVTDADLQARWKSEMADLTKRVGKEGEPALSEADVLKRAGTTKDEAQSELRKAMIVDLVRDQIMQEKGVKVTDQEVADWFANHKTSTRRPDMLHMKQIFFKADTTQADKRSGAAKQKADDAMKRLRAGESFEGVANKLSEGQYKDKGGEWPLMPADQFPDFIRNAAAKLKPGEISEPIESKFGYHIIKLIEVVPGQEGTIENSADRIKEALLADKGSKVLSEFCSKVTRDPARVQVYLDLQKQLALRPDLMKKMSNDLPPPTKGEKPAAPKQSTGASAKKADAAESKLAPAPKPKDPKPEPKKKKQQ